MDFNLNQSRAPIGKSLKCNSVDISLCISFINNFGYSKDVSREAPSECPKHVF